MQIRSRSHPEKIYEMVQTPDGWRHKDVVCEAGTFGKACWHIDAAAHRARERRTGEVLLSSANIFVVDENDMTVHFQLTVPDIGPDGAIVSSKDQLVELYALTRGMLSGLKRDGFKPDPSKGARKSGGNPNYRPPQQVMVNGKVLVCEKCQGPVWDNREKKASGQFKASSPDFSCKNRDGCGWVRWPEKEQVQGAVNPSGPVIPGGYVDREFASLAGTAALAEELPFP